MTHTPRHDTESKLFALLERRLPRPEWALFPQLRNGTGFAASRTLDALALNTYPSRGLEVHGFEMKCFRGDWLKELKNPDKAEHNVAYCDRWWIVAADKEVCPKEELPPTWGLLIPRGANLIAVVQAPKLQPKALDRAWIASILRNASEWTRPKAHEVEARKLARSEGIKEGKESAESEANLAKSELETLKKRVAAFEAESGVTIDRWDYPQIGRALRSFMSLQDPAKFIRDFEQQKEFIDGKSAQLGEMTREMTDFFMRKGTADG